MMEDIKVVLVDENDSEIGLMNKNDAHRKGYLHRAVSVFIINSRGEWLLQQRSLNKYHSAGLWTNTCCSHPLPGELNVDAATRRLNEEMGIENCALTHLFTFTYNEELANGLIEHEFDHVFLGVCDQNPVINEMEVRSYKFVNYQELKKDITANSEQYTVWFRKIYDRVKQLIP